MSDIKDGGPAFPQPVSCTPMGDLLHTEIPGVSILDYVAAKAMQAVVVNAGRNGFSIDKPADIAERAYLMADAMLQARGKIINEKV